MSLMRGLAVPLGISAALSAQSYTAVVVGSGYQTPPAILIAPGQIATFFVGGLPQTAAGLAKMAAQISVAAGQTQAIPVLSNQSVGPGTLAITVQFPFSGVPVTSSTEWFTYAGPYTVQFGETDNPAGDLCAEGACTGLLPLEPVFSSAHLVNMCDLFVNGAAGGGGTCPSAVFHQNGTLVTSSLPASVGEVVTAWAVGMGAPTGGIPAGTDGPIEMNDITLNFAYEASGFSEASSNPPAGPAYLWAGLPNPNQGLYQINFAVPSPPTTLAECAPGGGNLIPILGRVTPAAYASATPTFINSSGNAFCVSLN